MDEIRVIVTMDCEPTTATTDPSATGPKDWIAGERAARGYADIARSYGFPVTYFIHPETALAQADVFNDLARQGACLGLHMHPWKYSLWRYGGRRYLAHYGGLSEGEQRTLIAEASALWREAIGYQPLYFRPGTFSANDAIFKVLAELGFRGGSCSAPGRMLPEMRAIWTGAEPDPHRANPEFRQVRGTLEFANMPISMDFSALLTGREGRRMHADLRPDVDWPAQYGVAWKTIATNIVAQIKARAPQVRVISVLTHNHYDYPDATDPATQRLHAILTEIHSACTAAGVRPTGSTVAEVVDEVLGAPATDDPFVCEGGVFDISGTKSTLDLGARR